MALKRVCDITGSDRDVEICDVTIAGQTIKLDLSPAGAEKLREFFGPVVTVQHPLSTDGASAAFDAEAPAAGSAQTEETEAEETEAEESGAEEDGAEESEAVSESGADSAVPVAAVERPARRGRRSGAAAKSAPKNTRKNAQGGRKKPAPRRAVAPVAPDTSDIRDWARANGYEIGERGAIPGRIRAAYTLAHE